MDSSNNRSGRERHDADGVHDGYDSVDETRQYESLSSNEVPPADPACPGYEQQPPSHAAARDGSQEQSRYHQQTAYPVHGPSVPASAASVRGPKKKRTLPLVPAVVGGAALLVVGGFTGGAIGYGAGSLHDSTSQTQGDHGGNAGPGSQHGGPGMSGGQGSAPGQPGSGQQGSGIPGGAPGSGSGAQDPNSSGDSTDGGRGGDSQGTDSGSSVQSSDGAQNAALSASSYALARVNLTQVTRAELEDAASLAAAF